MNKTITITATTLFAIGVASCGLLPDRQVTTEAEENYVYELHYAKIVEVEMKTDEELIALGNYTCELFDNNVTPSDVIVKVVNKGNLQTGEAIDAIITEALLGLCPEYADVLNYG